MHACDRCTKHLYLFGCHLPAAKRKKEQLAAFVPELNEMMRAGCSGSPVVLISITLTWLLQLQLLGKNKPACTGSVHTGKKKEKGLPEMQPCEISFQWH